MDTRFSCLRAKKLDEQEGKKSGSGPLMTARGKLVTIELGLEEFMHSGRKKEIHLIDVCLVHTAHPPNRVSENDLLFKI